MFLEKVIIIEIVKNKKKMKYLNIKNLQGI